MAHRTLALLLTLVWHSRLTHLCCSALIFPVWFSAGFLLYSCFHAPTPTPSARKCIWQLFIGSLFPSLSLWNSCEMGLGMYELVFVFFCFCFSLSHLNLITSKQNHHGFTVECLPEKRTPGPNVLSHGEGRSVHPATAF